MNHLEGQTSPYLLQHADNPVDWYPWGVEAFEKAARESKPIFLSIGYSTCHWCHVMAHESFENRAIAEILNAGFVSVKVDREERPDVDRVYMSFVQATTGSGGWPMSVFLTPDLKPIVGGTYFPPRDLYGRPGFATVLRRVSDSWESQRDQLIEQGTRMIAALAEHSSKSAAAAALPAPEIFRTAFDQFAASFDAEWGGFGMAPKFPRPVALNFLLRFFAREPSPHGEPALKISLLTLQKMAEGGMHDHLGGGFHRYSVDRFWHIPHFEKMLYDQAQLAISYLEALQITRDASYERIARDILDYVRRDMTDPAGGFYSAEDADSLVEEGKPEHGEGLFYLWKKGEIESLLGAGTSQSFCWHFGVEVNGNAPPGSDPHGEFVGENTLIQRFSIAKTASHFGKSELETERLLSDARHRLLAARASRPRPHLDDKIIAAWNGLMISAFARAAQILDDPAYLSVATKAADFVRAHLWIDGKLRRSYRGVPGDVEAFVDDYAALVQGLLDLSEASFDARHLHWAIELQAKQDALFFDEGAGGYFSAAAGDPHILLRMKEDYDGAEPSPNSISALNLLRLSRLTGNEDYRARAERTIAAFSTQIQRQPTALPQMLVALDLFLAPPRQIVIAGEAHDPATQQLLRVVHRHFLPHTALFLVNRSTANQARFDFLKTNPAQQQATAYVCENFVCNLPITDPAILDFQFAK
jgi:uncharacterized protein YyaL (SSP411 family)